MLKFILAIFIFFISLVANSLPMDCVASFGNTQAANSQDVCVQTENDKKAEATQNADLEGNQTLAHLRLSKRQPSLAESIIAMLFIPGLILLWFSRLSKSNK